MRKDTTSEVVAMLVALIAMFLALSACDFTLTPYIDPDIIHNNPPDTTGNPIDTMPIDTTGPLVDTPCQSFITVTQPPFQGFWTNLDVLPSDVVWHYKNDTIDLETFFSQYGIPFIYYSGINIGGFIQGSYDWKKLNNQVWTYDGTGRRFYLAVYDKCFITRGALTFDQFFERLQGFPSVKFIEFYNCGFSCDQIQQCIDFLLADCKAAPPGGIIYLPPVQNQCITPEQVLELQERGWEIRHSVGLLPPDWEAVFRA